MGYYGKTVQKNKIPQPTLEDYKAELKNPIWIIMECRITG